MGRGGREYVTRYEKTDHIAPKKQNRVKRVEVKIGKFFLFFSF